MPVTSLVEVWIEISCFLLCCAVSFVTSLVEVWIEILDYFPYNRYHIGHFPCGSVDWNLLLPLNSAWSFCHFPCGSVDWNLRRLFCFKCGLSHFPCGSVDWNIFQSAPSLWIRNVTSLVEVWIEILMSIGFPFSYPSLPLWKCGLKSFEPKTAYAPLMSLPLWKCGLKLLCQHQIAVQDQVTSLVEVWIEIFNIRFKFSINPVTSLVEVWIEINAIY